MIREVESEQRVCPYCGEPPGAGVFCEACGRNLSQVEQLPTRAEWTGGAPAPPAPAPSPAADDCATATAAFLDAMRAAGNPGTVKAQVIGGTGLRRRPHVWVVRAVHRRNEDPRHYDYEPGLVLTTDGRFHRLQSEIRGWGQARFPVFFDAAEPDPIDTPTDAQLVDELAAVLRENGVAT